MSEALDFEPRAERYPPYVMSEEQRRRWDLATDIAELLFDSKSEVWLATRSIYRSPLPTRSFTRMAR